MTLAISDLPAGMRPAGVSDPASAGFTYSELPNRLG